LGTLPNVKTIEDFMERAIKIRERTKFHLGQHGKPYKCVVGGQVVHRMDCKSRSPSGVADVALVALFRKGYVVTIGASWQSGQERAVVEGSLNSIRFR